MAIIGLTLPNIIYQTVLPPGMFNTSKYINHNNRTIAFINNCIVYTQVIYLNN